MLFISCGFKELSVSFSFKLMTLIFFCKASLLTMKSLSFCLSGNFFISSLFSKNSFVEYRIIGDFCLFLAAFHTIFLRPSFLVKSQESAMLPISHIMSHLLPFCIIGKLGGIPQISQFSSFLCRKHLLEEHFGGNLLTQTNRVPKYIK